MALSFTYPTPLPSTKNWGPGWPNCQTDKIVPNAVFQGGVHKRINKLVQMLTAELEKQGYVFRDGWSWGYGCRSTKTSSGSQTETPSFHSWGLALDFNAPLNAFGAERSSTQLGKPEFQWVVKLMRNYGFYWLGPAAGDWMHFSFCGSPADADRMTAKAIENKLGQPDPAYKVAGRVFQRLGKAVDYARKLLQQGKDAIIRVVRR